MSHEIAQHVVDTGKALGGGAATAGTTWAALTLSDMAQYASIGAALATMVYFITMTVIGILKYKKTKTAK